MRKSKRSEPNVPDKDEMVLIESYVIIDDKTIKKDRWVTKKQMEAFAEELESEERLVYNTDINLSDSC